MADDVKIIRLVIDSSKAVDGSAAATRALANIDKATSDTAGAMARMEQSLGRIGGLIKAHLALAAAEAVGRLIEMGKAAFESAAGLEELAEQMGITAKGLQGLQFVAVQGGASMEKLETAVGKFSQKMGEAADGNKDAIESLKRLGVQNLDLQGKLRPTEDLLTDVAKAISEIDDPARRAAAAVDLFGKGGRALLPSLKDMADGFDTMALKAEAAGAMISAHTIKRLDEMADKMEVGKLKTRAFLAEGLVAIADWYSANKDMLMGLPIIGSIITLIENIDKIGPALKAASRWAGEAWADIKQAYADGTYEISGAFGRLLDTFSSVGTSIKNIFVNAMNGVIEAIEKGLNSARDALADSWVGKGAALVGQQLGISGGPISIPRVGGGGDPSAGPMMTNEQYYRNARGAPPNYRQQLQDQRGIEFAQWFAQMETSSAGYTPTTTGAGYSKVTSGGGDDPEKKYQKLEQQLKNTAAAQAQMTTAALAGDQAFETAKAELDAQNKLLEIYGTKLAIPADRLKIVSDYLKDIAQGKAREAFAVQTTEIQKANNLLEAQIRLFDAAPDVQARELAVIKATNEAKKAGEALDSDAFKARLASVETGEKLKIQYAQLQKAQELWTAPLKSALESIQKIGADAFDKFLENGKFSFDELSKVFSTTIRRMAAEFLALATIRPVMSVLVNAISPSMASQMGLGSSGGGSTGGGLFGGGGLSNIGGSIGSWLGSPISGSLPSGTYGPPAPGQGFSSGFLGDITWGQGLGAFAGAGMGAYQLLSGNGSTASTIGGISSIIGAGASLIPGIGPILGPAIGLLGNILPGLFGGTKQPIANDTYGQLSYGSGGFYTTGGAWGPDANSKQTESSLLSTGGSINSIFNLLGGVKNAGSVWGLSSSNTSKTGSGWDFSSTISSLINPAGGSETWRMNESDMMNTGAEQVARRSILGGAVGDISANMRKVVTSIGETTSATLEQLASAITSVKAFDDAIAGLGKTVTDSEKAIASVDQSFAALYDTATQYGLSTSDLDTAKSKARLGVATDFGKSISRQILDITNPAAGALQDLDAWKQTLIDNNKYLLENVTGALDQINDIEKLYGLKRATIVEQMANKSLDSLKNSLSRMLYGDLSGASPTDALSGAKGTYLSTLAKSFAGNADAATALGGDAADYLQSAASYYGTASSDFQAIRKQTIIDTASAYRISGGSFSDIPGGYDVIMGGNGLGSLAAPLTANVTALTTVSAQFVDLNVKLDEVLAAHTEQTNTATEFMELLRRMIAAG